MSEKLNGRRVAILVTDGFEQVELTEPREALHRAGATTRIIAPEKGKVQGMNHDEKADQFNVDMTTEEADPHNFDVLPDVRSSRPMRDIRLAIAARSARSEDAARESQPVA